MGSSAVLQIEVNRMVNIQNQSHEKRNKAAPTKFGWFPRRVSLHLKAKVTILGVGQRADKPLP